MHCADFDRHCNHLVITSRERSNAVCRTQTQTFGPVFSLALFGKRSDTKGAIRAEQETKGTCVCLLVSLEVSRRAVRPLAALEVAAKALDLPFARLLVHALNRERGMRWVLGHRTVARIDLHTYLVRRDGVLDVPAIKADLAVENAPDLSLPPASGPITS